MIVLFLSDISWYGLHQRPQHIALALAKEWTILWVQPSTLGSKSSFLPVAIQPNIYVVSVPAIPYNAKAKIIRTSAKVLSHLKPLRKIFTFLQIFLVRRALNIIGNDSHVTGVVIHNIQLIDVLENFRPSFVLYDYLDNVFGFTSLPRHIEEYWKKAIRLSDIITVTSPTLQKQIQQYRMESIYLIGNGVEYNFFSRQPTTERPRDLPPGKPIFGYVGAVYPWLDYELIEYAAHTMPEAEFVFIGPTHPDVTGAIQKLKQKHNIHFLGAKEYGQIPSYLYWFDVGIIPFQRNDLTLGVNPVKLYEYSAAGKPTVVSDFSDDLHQFKEIIFIARSKEEFVALLKIALQKTGESTFTSALKSFANKHDWNSKTSTIIQLIHKQLSLPTGTTKES